MIAWLGGQQERPFVDEADDGSVTTFERVAGNERKLLVTYEKENSKIVKISCKEIKIVTEITFKF